MTEQATAGTIGLGSAMPDRGQRALDWWQRLADEQTGDPGTLARLRRARSPLEALSVRAAVMLARMIGAAHGAAPDRRTRDALDLARVLAYVKEHDPSRRPMQAAGWKRFAANPRASDAGEDRPTLAEGRFRRLYETGDGEEKVAAFVRLVRLLGGTINVAALANDFLRWSHPASRDHVRERWAFDYYHASSAAPVARLAGADSDSPTDDEDIE